MRSVDDLETFVRDSGGVVDPFGCVNERTAAQLLSVSYDTLQSLRRNDPKRCPPYKRIGGSARYNLSRLAQWLTEDDRKIR